MRFAFLALFGGFLSCQTATQITVELRGVGVACPSGDSPTIEQTGVLAKRQLQSRSDLPELGVLGDQCDATDESSVVSLGDIVLVPADGPGPVEVLALGALKIGDAPAVSADDCRAEYERLFGSPCEIGEGRACESCIFARRSVAFVKHSKLEITIDLEATCAGVICDPSQTCSKGACVSAEASCEEDGSCTLVNENEGGAGGDGGAGGEGGGGGMPDVWTPLWQPATSDCQGADPSDVIGGLVNGGQGPTFRVLVPAGRCMLVLDEGAAPAEHTVAAGTSGNDYRAVAKGMNGDFVTLGDGGTARLQSAPPFSVLSAQLTDFDPEAQAIAWDISGGGTATPIGWTRSYQDDPGTSGQIVPFASGGPLDSIFRGALFAVYPLESADAPITFGAWAGNLAARRGALTSSTKVPAPPGWSLWAEELAGDTGTFQMVAVGAKTDAVYAGRCTDIAPGVAENCDFGVQGIALVPPAAALSSREVEAIWGLQTISGIALYAVGEDAGVGPWLGRAILPPSSGTLDWTFAGLPSEMLGGSRPAIKSLWVGLTGGTGATVIVVGPAGVFRAQLDELEFLMEP